MSSFKLLLLQFRLEQSQRARPLARSTRSGRPNELLIIILLHDACPRARPSGRRLMDGIDTLGLVPAAAYSKLASSKGRLAERGDTCERWLLPAAKDRAGEQTKGALRTDLAQPIHRLSSRFRSFGDKEGGSCWARSGRQRELARASLSIYCSHLSNLRTFHCASLPATAGAG